MGGGWGGGGNPLSVVQVNLKMERKKHSPFQVCMDSRH